MIQPYTIYDPQTGRPTRWGNNDPGLVEVPEDRSILVGETPPEGKWLDPSTLAWVDPPEQQADPATTRARMHLTPRQLLIGLYTRGLATSEECIAAATTGSMPSAVAAVVDQLPEADQVVAKITWGRMTQVDRTNSLVEMIASAANLTEEQVDAFFVEFSGV